MKHQHKSRIVAFLSVALLSLTSITGFISPQSAAALSGEAVALGFSSLPSADGWVYGSGDGSSDTSFFSVSGGQLHMNTIGSGFSGHSYTKAISVDSSPFTLAIRARVANYEEQSDGRNPYGFDVSVFTGTQQFEVGISPVGIKGGLAEPGDTTADHVFSTSVDVTQFHDYRIEAVPGRFELFIDGVSFGSASPTLGNTPSMLYFGDGTAGANAQVDIAEYRFEQGQYRLPFTVGPVNINQGPSCSGKNHNNTQSEAIDYNLTEGTSVVATASGKVIYADWFNPDKPDKKKNGSDKSDFGQVVLVEHNDGRVSYYAHLSGFAVTEGDLVTRGQLIGFSGSTGKVGAHLHFEIRENTIERDPGNPDDGYRYGGNGVPITGLPGTTWTIPGDFCSGGSAIGS